MVYVRVKRRRWSCGWPVRATCTPWRPRPRRPRRTLPQNSGKWGITLFGLKPFLFFAVSVATAAVTDAAAAGGGVEATAESDDDAAAETAAAAKAALQYLQGAGIQTRDSATLTPCGH